MLACMSIIGPTPGKILSKLCGGRFATFRMSNRHDLRRIPLVWSSWEIFGAIVIRGKCQSNEKARCLNTRGFAKRKKHA